MQALPAAQGGWAIFPLQPAGTALSTPLEPECRLSVSSVPLQQAAQKDLSGTSTAGYEKLNGKEKNPNTMKEQKKNVEGNL